MATLTATAPIASLDELLAHPLCQVAYTGVEVDDPDTSRFHFVDAAGWEHGEDCANDRCVVEVGQLFIDAGRPFTLTIDEPWDVAATEAEIAEDRRELALLWAYHGPGC